MTLNNLDQLLLDLFRCPHNVKAAQLEGLSEGDLAYVIEKMQSQRCAPYLDWWLETAGYQGTPRLSGAQRERLSHRNLRIQGEMIHIHRLLVDNGIDHLFLKGAVLGPQFYPHPWMRSIRDLDILIRPAQIDQAFDLLIDAGGHIEQYVHLDRGGGPGAKHMTPIWSPNQVIAVELHNDLFGVTPYLDSVDVGVFTEQLWAGASTFQLGANALPCPAPEAMLIHLIFHAVYDHEFSNGPQFVSDLNYILRGHAIDLPTLMGFVNLLGIEKGAALAFNLLSADTPQREAILNAMQVDISVPLEAIVDLMFESGQRKQAAYFATAFADANFLQKIALVLGRLVPSRATMQTHWLTSGQQGEPPRLYPHIWGWFVVNRVVDILRFTTSGGGKAGVQGAVLLRHLLKN